MDEQKICDWAFNSQGEMAYHDQEWGMPLSDDNALFEFICLEGAQAGLSWRTILDKRPAYRAAFANFDIQTLAKQGIPDEQGIAALIAEYPIVKNKLKIKSVYSNAIAAQALQTEYGSLAKAMWQFVDETPIVNQYDRMQSVPTSTDASAAMSKFLKKKGFKFVGETICYALMQAVGMVNDHLTTCPQYDKCKQAAENFSLDN